MGKALSITLFVMTIVVGVGCGGGMQVGGPGLSENDETFIQDDPLQGGAINEGTGSVIP